MMQRGSSGQLARVGGVPLALIAAAVSVPAIAAASALSATQVVERVQQRFAACESLAARFEKQFVWAALERTSTRHGKIYLQRPDRFRVELDDGSLLVADGQAIWSYSSRNQQAVVSAYHGDVQTPWEVLTDYRSRYLPVAVEEAALGKHACYLLTLRPQSPSSTVSQMRVWVDRGQWHPRRVEQRETSGNVTTYTLTEIRTDQRLDEELFRFHAPAGTQIIDSRPQAEPDVQ